MKFLEIIVLLLLLVVIAMGFYAIWSILTLPEEINYEHYTAQFPDSDLAKGLQFYSKMRFPEKRISYFVENRCSENKRNNVIMAFSLIEEKTNLEFYSTNNNPRIQILCSEIAPEPEQKNHFIAGEGGPTKIINTSNYFVMLESKVSLYREDKCEEPKIALHEILHTLGFDHVNNEKSIMYPITECDQQLDDFIVEEINRLYEAEAAPDLVLEAVSAKQLGRYLSFQANITNIGLVDMQEANLSIYAEGKLVKSYALKDGLEIGSRNTIKVYNLRVNSGTRELKFIVVPITPSNELSINNNEAVISLSE